MSLLSRVLRTTRFNRSFHASRILTTEMSSTVATRQLGKGGPQVSAEGYGCMGLSAMYGPPKPDAERFAFLDHLYESGVRFWDSADLYGDSEQLLGRWFAAHPGRREQITLATKFAMQIRPDGARVVRNDPGYVREACERSLARLGLPGVDLYYCHRLNGEVPVEVVVSAMAELVREGKARHIGLSEVSAASLRRAHAVHPIAAVQVEYSPWSTEVESNGVLAACRELGIALVAYAPLGRGFLTGRFRSPDDIPQGDFRKSNPRFSPENFPRNLQVVDTLTAIATRKGVTPSQLTLAWLMRQDPCVIPIPGTTSVKNFEDNKAALAVHLTDGENAEIRKVVDGAQIVGDRYVGKMNDLLFMDSPPYEPGKVTWSTDGVPM